MSPGQAGDRVNVLCKLYRAPLGIAILTEWGAGAAGPTTGHLLRPSALVGGIGVRHCDCTVGATLLLDAHAETRPGCDMESKVKVTVSQSLQEWMGRD